MSTLKSPLELENAPLLIAPPAEIVSQHESAVRIFGLLGLRDVEQRFSDSYPPSFQYFVAKLASGSLKLIDHDDVGLISRRFPYALVVDRAAPPGPGDPIPDWQVIARTLSWNGFHTFLCEDIWTKAQSYEGWMFSPDSPDGVRVRLEN